MKNKHVNSVSTGCRAALVLVCTMCLRLAVLAAGHPLDPLSEQEIAQAASVVRAYPSCPPHALFSLLALHEPAKDDVLRFRSGMDFRREVFAILLDRRANTTYEAVVDLAAQRVTSWKKVPDVQPPVLMQEYALADSIVRLDTRWQAAMRRRGILDFSTVQIDAWAAGNTKIPGHEGARLLRALSYFRDTSTNFYGRPVEGVIAIVNMNTLQVVQLIDNEALPMPPPGTELDTGSIVQRPAPALLRHVQPDGPGYRVQGSEIRWQNWQFRFAFHPREGLVLYTVGYNDGGTLRPVLYRASLSEMVVPYGDPDSMWSWRAAFDVGEYGIGRLSGSLEPHSDAPDHAQFFDAVFADDEGNPYRLERAVGVYERDGGLLWKHAEMYTATNESRRARELVLFFITTVGNYDYGISYIFHQDGTLEVEAMLTGIMLPKGVRQTAAETGDHESGQLVSPNVVAPNHQHFLNFRLDLDIDGTANSFVEMDTWAPPGGTQENPGYNTFVMDETVFRGEREARRRMSLQHNRKWKFVNTGLRTDLGYNPGYMLVPGENSTPCFMPEHQARQRAGFVNNHVWATSYHPGEMYAAGDYPNQSAGGGGLPAWTEDNESIVNRDLVLWYTMGITHMPRPEEWPVMPVHAAGFKLVPTGFFTRNPALDVPK